MSVPTDPLDLSKIQERMAHLRTLRADWDSYGGVPIDERAIQAAYGLLDLLWHHQPSVIPRSNGGVQLEWHSAEGDYEIVLEPNGSDEADAAD